MNIRYSLLPYTYTLFHKAHQAGETVLRALAWEFPNDPQLAGVDNQFMSGPALLVTPVLAPLATTVRGVFPGVAEGTRWYDWYTLGEVEAAPGENKTLEAPLLHQPIFIRGGYILPIQKAGNTTKTSRLNPWSLIVALDKEGKAEGSLYFDDGINIVQKATKEVKVSFLRWEDGFVRLRVSTDFYLFSCRTRTTPSTLASAASTTTTCRSRTSRSWASRAKLVVAVLSTVVMGTPAGVQSMAAVRAASSLATRTAWCMSQLLRARPRVVFGMRIWRLLWSECGGLT